MIKAFLLFLLLTTNALAIFKEGPVTVLYTPDGNPENVLCTHPEHQTDFGLGIGMRVGDLKLRPNGDVVLRHPPPEPGEEPPEDPPDDPPPEPEPTPVWVTNVQFFGTEATTARKAKYNIGLEMVERVMNENGGNDAPGTNVFKNRVLAYDSSYTSGGSAGSRGFVAASGSGAISETNAQVYKHHWDGNETRPSATLVDNEADMEIEFYYANNSTVGYTYTSSKRVWVNTKFYDTYKPSSAMGNFFHEWSHKLGYGHEVGNSAYRPYTVPYGIGYLMRDSCVPLNSEYGY